MYTIRYSTLDTGHGTRTAALPKGAPPLRMSRTYAEAVSSSRKPRVLFGSTGMPGAMVVVKVIFFR